MNINRFYKLSYSKIGEDVSKQDQTVTTVSISCMDSHAAIFK